MKRILFLVVINVIPLFFIIAHCDDLWSVYYGKEDYPFGSAFFAPYSIYQSKALFVSFTVIQTLFLVGLVACSIFREWKIYRILLVICILMFFYPILTNE